MLNIATTTVLVVFSLFIISGCSSLQIRAETEVTMNPSKIHEECMKLLPGDVLSYSFNASDPVDFNIHFHDEKNISYPVSKKRISGYEGTYSPAKEHMYCIMWTNVQKFDVQLTYALKVEKK